MRRLNDAHCRDSEGDPMKLVRANSLIIILLAGLMVCQRDSIGAPMQQADDHALFGIDESGGAAGEPADLQIARAIAELCVNLGDDV
jgi:hypothetical protein